METIKRIIPSSYSPRKRCSHCFLIIAGSWLGFEFQTPLQFLNEFFIQMSRRGCPLMQMDVAWRAVALSILHGEASGKYLESGFPLLRSFPKAWGMNSMKRCILWVVSSLPMRKPCKASVEQEIAQKTRRVMMLPGFSSSDRARALGQQQ